MRYESVVVSVSGELHGFPVADFQGKVTQVCNAWSAAGWTLHSQSYYVDYPSRYYSVHLMFEKE